MNAAETRLREHLPVVEQEALRLTQTNAVARDDLRSAGTLALWRACERPDWDNVVGCVRYLVRNAMIDELRRQSYVSRRALAWRKRRARVEERLMQELRRQPTDSEVAAAMEPGEGKRVHPGTAFGRSLSRVDLNAPITEDGRTLADVVPAETDLPGAEMEREEVRRAVGAELDRLPERLRAVMVMRFRDGISLLEIAGRLRVTESRACQMVQEGVEMLRGRVNRRDAA